MTQAELLATVDDAWRPFREAVRGVGRARMNDLTTRRLRKFRETGTFPGPGDEVSGGLPSFRDADAFNARVVASHRLIGAEALIDELDTAFGTLRSEHGTLSVEQIHLNDDWVIAIVTGNTFGHDAQHASELSLE